MLSLVDCFRQQEDMLRRIFSQCVKQEFRFLTPIKILSPAMTEPKVKKMSTSEQSVHAGHDRLVWVDLEASTCSLMNDNMSHDDIIRD